MKNSLFILLIGVLALSNCIGTDIVEEVVVPEEVSITSSIDSLMVGDSFVFGADYFDMFGRRAEDPITWSSSDESVISITQAGLAMALSAGDAYIRAAVGNAIDSVKVNSGDVTSMVENVRMGMFQGLSSYNVEGVFTLTDTGDNLELTFGSDFRASNGPGLFIYLSNASRSVNGGIELGALQSNSGTQTYVISKDRAQLNSYSHVVVYCRPFGVAFGFGEFDN